MKFMSVREHAAKMGFGEKLGGTAYTTAGDLFHSFYSGLGNDYLAMQARDAGWRSFSGDEFLREASERVAVREHGRDPQREVNVNINIE
jgi:hypothetical protein